MRSKQIALAITCEVQKDWPIYLCVATYGGIVAVVAGHATELDKLSFLSLWSGVFVNALRLPALFLLYLCALSIWSSPAAPATELRRQLILFFSPRVVAAFLLIAVLALFLGMFTTAKNLLPSFSSFLQNEKQIADLDVLLHGQAVWLYFQPTLDYIGARRVFEFVYGPVWFLAITGLPFLVVTLERFNHVRRPFLISWLLCWILLGNVAAGYFLSAGPMFYGQVTGDFDRFRELAEHVAASKGLQFSAFDIQSSLWSAYTAKHSYLGTGISAFPSVHVSMATLIYLMTGQGAKIFRISAALFLLMIFVGSVYLGWHYAVDGYFSIGATIIIWNAVTWVERGNCSSVTALYLSSPPFVTHESQEK